MKRLLGYAGSIVGVLVVGLVIFVLWASGAGLAPDQYAQVKEYPGTPRSDLPDTVSVMTYNVGYLSGMTNNQPVERPDSLFDANMDQAVDLIRTVTPDVIALQEIDYGGARVGHVHQLDTMATRLGYPAAAQAVNWDERYLPFPYGPPSVHFGRTLSGQSILSRFPIEDHLRRVLPRPPQAFFRDAFYLDRLAQVVLVSLGGRAWALVNLHLEAFHRETREKQAVIVQRLFEQLRRANLPVLVLGDLNSTVALDADSAAADSALDETMRTLLGNTPLRPVFGDDTTREAAAPATYPADDPKRKIDYLLYSPTDVQPVERDVLCGGSVPPSDHCAVFARFDVRDGISQGPRVGEVAPLDSLLAR